MVGFSRLLRGLTRCFLPLALVALSTQIAAAQMDPRQILTGVIYQLQTGTPNPLWYGPQLWQTIAMQTGSTGFYPPLSQLGPVAEVSVNERQQLPTGTLYLMTAVHQGGSSIWLIGISSITNRIEYASFDIGGTSAPPAPTPFPNPIPNPLPTPNPDRRTSPGGGDTSSACQKFPNLC